MQSPDKDLTVRGGDRLNLALISPRERQAVLLLALFFKAKRNRLKLFSDTPPVVEPTIDSTVEPGINYIRWFFAQMREEKSDIQEDIVGFFASAVLDSPERGTHFSNLSDSEVEGICSAAEEWFEDAEREAEVESWSQYEQSPETFFHTTPGYAIVNCNGFGIPELQKWRNFTLDQRNELIDEILKSYAGTNPYKMLNQEME